MKNQCYWTYCPNGEIIIAGPTKERYHKGYFRSLTSARRFVRKLGYDKLVRDHNPHLWGTHPEKSVEVFPWVAGAPDPNQMAVDAISEGAI